MYDNVLEDSNADKAELKNCKLKYLKVENQVLTLQLKAVCDLVDLHKKILDSVSGQASE